MVKFRSNPKTFLFYHTSRFHGFSFRFDTLQNLVTLVTGGASGLGRATAHRLAKKGAQVVFCDLPTSNGEEVAKEIGENVSYIPADITSETDVKNLVQQINEKYGKLNVLVNCAGLADAFVAYNFETKRAHSLKDYEKIIWVRFFSLLALLHLISFACFHSLSLTRQMFRAHST